MKKNILLILVTGILALEAGFFFYIYFFGEHGYKKIQRLQLQQDEIDQVVKALRVTVSELEKKLEDFKDYPYYKEKIIREQLQMIKPHEVIYKQSQ